MAPWLKLFIFVLVGFAVGAAATFGVGFAFFGDQVRGDETPAAATAITSTPTTRLTATTTTTTTTTRLTTTAAPQPTLPPQWGLAGYLEVSEFECTGRDWAIGASGNLTNLDSITHDVWVTVDLLDEPGEVRIDRLQTYVPGIGPGETVRFEVERYQGTAVRFMCEVSGLSRYANW